MRDPERRFWAKTTPVSFRENMTPCLQWVGTTRNQDGYGSFRFNGELFLAHRWIYQRLFGETELEIHHECENKKCVNPGHLDAKTRTEHRAEHVRTHCVNGHPFDSRVEKQQICRTCRNAANQRYKDRLRGDRPKQRRLSDEDRLEIARLRADGKLLRDIATQLHTSTTTVKAVLKGARMNA